MINIELSRKPVAEPVALPVRRDALTLGIHEDERVFRGAFIAKYPKNSIGLHVAGVRGMLCVPMTAPCAPVVRMAGASNTMPAEDGT